MYRIEGVLATDQVTRDRTVLTPGALAGGLVQAYGLGMPSLVSHDNSRPIGWTTPRVLYFEPHFTRFCGIMEVAENGEERERLRRALGEFWQRHTGARKADVTRLRELLGEALIGDEEVLPVECTSLYSPGIARRALPKIFAAEDADGLVELSVLDMLAPGIYRAGSGGELVVFAHHFLRRSLSPLNSLNVPLLELLHDLEPTQVRPRVALDPDIIGLAATYRPMLEHQYWWGPVFSDDLASIPPGVTVHGASERERFYHGVSRTEFFWYSRKGEHTLEVEEVRDLETAAPRADPVESMPEEQEANEPTPFGCRYAHAIVAEATGELTHFDGAVRLYTETQMVERLDHKLDQTSRDKAYRKLWRIDGGVPVATWKRVLSDFFRDNHLVGEYLGAPQDARDGSADSSVGDNGSGDIYRAKRADALLEHEGTGGRATEGGPRAALAIVSMPAQDGERGIHPETTLSSPGMSQMRVHVCEAVDVVKLIRRCGGDVEFDSGTGVVEFDDTYHNLPVVWHQTPAAVPVTIRAIHSLVDGWAQVQDGKMAGTDLGGHAVSFSVGVRLPQMGVDLNRDEPLPANTALLMSVRGEASDVAQILGVWDSTIQPALERPSGQVSAVADALAGLLRPWTASHDGFDAVREVLRTLSLSFEREQLSADEWTIERHPSAEKLVANVRVDRHPNLVERLEHERLFPAKVYMIYDRRCSLCCSAYDSCPHVPYVDPDCHIEIHDWRVLGASLTNRPAWDPDASPGPAGS